MTSWKTDARLGLVVGIGLVISILLVDAGLIWLATARPLAIGTFIIGLAVLVSLGLLGLLTYWLYGLARSGYSMDRNVLVIHWGPMEQTIPTGQIERVVVFRDDEVEGLDGGQVQVLKSAQVEEPFRFHGGMWPGHCTGYGKVPGAGDALFYATVSPRHQIYIVTPGLTYGISPADEEGFLESLRKRLEMGPTQIVEQSSKRPGFLDWTIWEDRLGLGLLMAGLLAILALIGLLCFRFPTLPRLVSLHFDAAGNPDRLEPRGRIFLIPLIGVSSLLLNDALGALAYRRERMASYLLWGGAILVQALVWTAALGILGRL